MSGQGGLWAARTGGGQCGGVGGVLVVSGLVLG